MRSRGLVALVVVLGVGACGCEGKTTTRPSTSTSRSSSVTLSGSVPDHAAVPAASGTSTRSPARHEIVYFADVQGPGRVFVTVGPGPQGGLGVRVMASTIEARAFRNVGPHVPADEGPDSLFFLNGNIGWFTIFSFGGGSETLYRTVDAGRRWQSFPAPGHVLAGGSTSALWFTSAEQGWLSDIEPTGPGETLFHTTDGGATWHAIATTRSTPGGAGSLPRLGVAEFDPDGKTGWMGGTGYSGPLDVTHDGGHSWSAVSLPDKGAYFQDPALLGQTVIEPALNCSASHKSIHVDVSIDNGAHWTSGPATPLRAGSDNCLETSVVLPTTESGWLTTRVDGQISVLRTTDQGRHWINVTAPKVSTMYAPTIYATDATHAWLTIPAGNGSDVTRIYATNNSGQSWHRVDHLATQ
jgi:photosystem II stability/assembly factor-like uncharacterized protein